MTYHTAWKLGIPRKFHDQNYIPIVAPLMGELMTDVCWVVGGEDAARFIVTACNNYGKMLEALRDLVTDYEEIGGEAFYDDSYKQAKQAIRNAEESEI